MTRVRLSLDGLGLGDALGEMLSYHCELAPHRLASETNQLPPKPWRHTDDTEMAISIAAVLKSHGYILQEALAKRFSRRFERDPARGYGRMTRIQMQQLLAGGNWRDTAAQAFSGQGSMGNGGAMRVAPLGAYFANELERCAEQARASAVVTHTHPEGVAGAVAVAIAAAMAWQLRASPPEERPVRFFEPVLRHTPESVVQTRIGRASSTPAATPVELAAKTLGNGSLVTAPDTVPFCLWMAAHHLGQFKAALGKTIGADGDCDTNAAIVAGIVALSAGRTAIPNEWLLAREFVRL
jgi:ADP-ribosylglycohydrolase